MSDKKQSVNSTKPNKGTAIPKLVKFMEAALIVAFFVVICLLKLYYWAYCKSERLRWRLLLIMPTRKSRNR